MAMGACSSNPGGQDMSVADMSGAVDMACNPNDNPPSPSACGAPCDTGNEKGVGKFCRVSTDCTGNGSAVVCSSILNTPGAADNTYFCTLPTICDPAGANICGSGASCHTQPGKGSGCVPDRCFGLDH